MRTVKLFLACLLAGVFGLAVPVPGQEQVAHAASCPGDVTFNGGTPTGTVTSADGNVLVTATFTATGPGYIPESCDISYVDACEMTVNGASASPTCTASPGTGPRNCSVYTCTITMTATVRPPADGTYTVASRVVVSWGCCLWRTGGTDEATGTWTFDYGATTDCNDGADNDGDGRTDYPADPGCASPTDTSELTDCPPVAPGVVFCATPNDTAIVDEVVLMPGVADGAEHVVKGYLDAYRFVLPGAGPVVVPCVVLVQGGTEVNPCEDQGGTFDSRTATLVDQSFHEPDPQLGDEVAAVRICAAEIKLTVLGFGSDAFPGYWTC